MSNTRSLIIGIFVIIILIVGAIVLVRFLRSRSTDTNSASATVTQTPQNSPTTSGNSMSLDEENRSGVIGDVTLEPVGEEQVRVNVRLTKYPQDTLQPGNVYMGTCDEPGTVLYPLADTFNGQSTTTLETTVERLNNQKPLIVALMKSQKDNEIAACSSL